MKRLFIYILSLCSCIPSACFSPQELIEPVEVLTANKWILCKMSNEPISLKDFEKGSPSLKFEKDGRLMIFTGCDYINGYFALNGNALGFDFPTEKNTCKNDNPLITDFLAALKSSTRFTTVAQQLVLTDNNTILMSFFPK